ncbi:MAG: hypothetical protein JRN21_08545 [Nitrososphaerota archaeon]|nr:hypothetical protein [Nitrososphaerota archaeon]
MIEGLKKRFGIPDVETDWAVDQEFESEETTELPSDSTVLFATGFPKSYPDSNDVDLREYYRGVMRAAIQHEGRYQGQQMPFHWLVMTLAGLEMKPISPEALWEQSGMASSPIFSDVSLYEELFPSDK